VERTERQVSASLQTKNVIGGVCYSRKWKGIGGGGGGKRTGRDKSIGCKKSINRATTGRIGKGGGDTTSCHTIEVKGRDKGSKKESTFSSVGKRDYWVAAGRDNLMEKEG